MQKLTYSERDFAVRLDALFNRPGYPPEIEESVAAILKRVHDEGDKALVELAAQFDNAQLAVDRLRVTQDEIDAAEKQVDAAEKRAIKTALNNVQTFAKLRIPKTWKKKVRPGVTLGEQFTPMERIGVYIPGGTAPLVSTIIHTAGIAGAARVKEIVAVTPPAADGSINPTLLYAMKQAGVTEIYRLGGVYGIGAMAYGTESVRKVEKIVGPGNAYVTAAKKLVYGDVAIDMVAGPSEIMVIADETADPAFIAADMLSQAEHGSGLEQCVLLTTEAELPAAVEKEIMYQRDHLKRQQAIDKVLAKGCFLIHVQDREMAADIASRYAPEHLEIHCAQPEALAAKIRSAGAIFLGPWTPESLGDFCAGPSHVLPTAGSARFFSGLTVEGFFRRSSLVKYSKNELLKELPVIEQFARMETLDAHGMSALLRGRKKS